MPRAPRNRVKLAKSRRSKRTKSRRSNFRKKNSTYNKTKVQFGLGLPKRATVTHRYVETIVMTSTAGVIAKQQFIANGMFKPNITSSGHQPLYFDQFTALYDHYTIIGSKITVKVCAGTANEAASQFTIMLNDDTSSSNITDPDNAFEQSQHAPMKLLPPNTNNTYTLHKGFSPKKTFGGSILGNDLLQGTSTTNPTEASYYDLYFASVGSANTTCAVQVLIEFIAVWDELKEVAQS